jgi:deoxyadenosine/deoxycytidine kinase
MLTFPTQNLFIEGSDCAGKTTLIRKIHDITGYRRHIHDRSQISRKIFADLYQRNLDNLESDFHLEISNLNNRFVFLYPDFETVKDRFLKRGDEIHKDISSIKRVYDEFLDAYIFLSQFPNISGYGGDDTGEIAGKLSAYLDIVERCMLKEVSDQVSEFVKNISNESYPLSFTLYDDGKFEESTESSMSYGPEKEYYFMIHDSLIHKIEMELSGENEYNRVEGFESRRFVFADKSCISFIQVAVRNNIMDFNVVLRSTDVATTFPHDLKFLYYLASKCWKVIGIGCIKCRLRFNLNSAHIIG